MIIFFNFSNPHDFERLVSKFTYQDRFISSARGNLGTFRIYRPIIGFKFHEVQEIMLVNCAHVDARCNFRTIKRQT